MQKDKACIPPPPHPSPARGIELRAPSAAPLPRLPANSVPPPPRLQPNSGSPEFGRFIDRPKSETSDFGWRDRELPPPHPSPVNGGGSRPSPRHEHRVTDVTRGLDPRVQRSS